MVTLIFTKVSAQTDLEKIEWKTSVEGNLQVSSSFYQVKGIDDRRDPFFWLIQANTTISLGPVKAPFSANFSSQTKSFTHPKPFNHFGISPSYKAFTGHFGYRSLCFSEYTINGHQFLGIGLEYDAQNIPFKVKSFYGRLQKAGISRSYTGIPLYERRGQGAQLTYKKQDNEYAFVLFKAHDDPQSLPDSTARENQITPASNLILSTHLQQKILKSIRFEFEYALSAFTKDIRTPELTLEQYTYINNFGNLYQPRASSRTNGAISAKFTYDIKQVQLNLNYRRIGSDYRSLGAPYLNNDLLDMTAGINFLLFKKINLQLNGGMEKNDLQKERIHQSRRMVGNMALSWSINDKFNLNGSYANYSTRSTLQQFVRSTTGINPDTVFFRQVNANSAFGLNYQLPGEELKKSFILITNYQKAQDNNENHSKYYNLNAGFNGQHSASNTALNLSCNLNNISMVSAETFSMGPVIVINRSILKEKLKLSFQAIYQQHQTNGKCTGNTQNSRFGIIWPLSKKQNLQLNTSLTRKKIPKQETGSFREFKGTINYRIRL